MAIARAFLSHLTEREIDGHLEDRYEFDEVTVRVVDELHLYLESVHEYFPDETSWIAVVSRHAGDTGPLLTAHFPGNIADAEYGGDPRSLPPACPRMLWAYRRAIADECPTGYETGLECTHHGPTDSTVPLCYVEIGSGPDQWMDVAPARAIARALWRVRDEPALTDRQLVGIGGGHYAPRFDRIIRETDWAVGHIAPSWALSDLESDELKSVIAHLFEMSDASYALIDGEYPTVADTVTDLGFAVVGERWLRATSRLPIPVVERLEAELAPLDAGLHLGEQVVDTPEAIDIRVLPDALMEECASIDLDGTVAAAVANSIAFSTDEEGSRPAGDVAIADGATIRPLIEALAAILEHKYDEVEVTETDILASRRVFDPTSAREMGVPEGPLFGQLAGGESVSVDDRTVEPEDVTRMTHVRFDFTDAVRHLSDTPGEA